jgi:hypothetical protein
LADITGMIERLVAAGADPVVAACVVAEAVIAGHETTAYRGDEAAERRREKDRARKAAEREAKRASADNPQKSADSADGADATVSLSPVPPSFPPHPPNNPLTPIPIHSEANASGADAPIDPSIAERDFFKRGREVLGKSAGGQLTKLKRAKGGNVALARSTLELAATKENPAEFVAAAIRGPQQSQGPPPGKGGFVTVLMEKHMERQHGTGNLDADDDERGASGGFADRAGTGR